MKSAYSSQTKHKALNGRHLNEHAATPVAIIGIAFRATGASDKEAYWEIMKHGIDCTGEVDRDKWGGFAWYHPDPQHEGTAYCKRCGFMPDADKFDPLFFNIARQDAAFIDPQQRVFLEEAWKCLEDAGYAPSSLSGKNVGVFAGVSAGDYFHLLHQNGMGNRGVAFAGNSNGVLAARIAHFLNLKGPALAIDTSCSSALVAIDRAVRSIQSGECEMALAGGVYISATPSDQILTSRTRLMSKNGQCRVFDNQADGLVMGEAVGSLLLKPLPQAIADKENIYGIIKGSDLRHNGSNIGIQVPSIEAQSELQQSIFKKFHIDPGNTSYIEAFSVGTPRGDQMEVSALIDAFRHFTDKRGFCALGSVKSNIGHTSGAAGICGMVKVLLMFQHKQLVPQANFNTLNKRINLNESPFYINTELKEWETINGCPKQAAISCFGFSGMNAHLVLEEYVQERVAYTGNEPAIILLSAKNKEQLKKQAANLRTYLQKNEPTNLHDVAYTLQVGREVMEERLAFAAISIEDVIQQLQSFQAGELVNNAAINWTSYYKEGKYPNKLSLPTYPFARERYWISSSDNILSKVNTNYKNGNQASSPAQETAPISREAVPTEPVL